MNKNISHPKVLRLQVALVSETNRAFINQTKLCLYSLRKNGGVFSQAPITLITNSEPLPLEEELFFREKFSPIEFRIAPRLGGIVHTSKLNVFYSIDPSSYDILLYLDCDTVIRKNLDIMLDPIVKNGVQFLCRRGGTTDRNRFVDFDMFVHRYCGKVSNGKILYDQQEEWPMFNSGVFLVTSEAVMQIRRDAIEFSYLLYNQWHRIDAFEGLPFLKYLYRLGMLPSRQKILEYWPIEQGALALACIKAGTKVAYLDEIFNSWGNIDFSILHCFKSVYKFDRKKMFTKDIEVWLIQYSKSKLLGKIFLAEMIRGFIKENP